MHQNDGSSFVQIMAIKYIILIGNSASNFIIFGISLINIKLAAIQVIACRHAQLPAGELEQELVNSLKPGDTNASVNHAIFCSSDDLGPVSKVITWTNADSLPAGRWGVNLSEIWIGPVIQENTR